MVKTEVSTKDTIRSVVRDAKKYHRFYLSPGFMVTLSYRVRRLRKFGAAWCQVLLPLDIMLGLMKRLFSDTTIPYSLSIGPRLFFAPP